MNAIKSEVISGFKEISVQAKKDKWFILSLAFLTILFIISLFFEPAIYAAAILMAIMAICFDLEKSLCLFLFSYPFDGIFYLNFGNSVQYTFIYIYSVIFAICFLKYLLDVFKLKKQVNYNIFLPLFIFLFYLALPIHKVIFYDMLKYIVAFSIFYLVVIYKKEIEIKRLTIYASIGLILSCLISFLVPFAERMPAILGEFDNYGAYKFQALFTNPNWLAVFSIILLALLIGNCLKKSGPLWLILFIPILIFSYMTLSRDYILCLILLTLYYLISLIIKRDKIKAIYFAVLSLIIMSVALVQINNTKIYILRLNTISNEITEDFNVMNQPPVDDTENGDFWIDGTPNDPGRWLLWKRYLKDYVSSLEKILFGAGVSAEALGCYTHNSYIEYVWQYGLLGLILGFIAFIRVLGKMFKNLKCDIANALLLVILFIEFVEGNLFNHVWIIMMVLFVASCNYEFKEDLSFYDKRFLKYKNKNGEVNL